VTTLPFTAPYLLAPMEGVTEPCFRELVLERNGPTHLGGTFTEFVRVVRDPLPERRIRDHLGRGEHPQPVGVQLMGSAPDALAETARRAARAGAPLVDLNFGCPAKKALKGCAGAALLDEPARVESLVRAVAEAGAGVPVSAKIRAGGEDDTHLEEIAQAVEAGGAHLLTVHCRTRREGYADTADWERLRRAVRAVSIPVCGNGGISGHADLERLRLATGCALSMVGRAALADPWIFTGRTVTRGEAALFLLAYAERLSRRRGLPRERTVPRVKQLLAHWTAGGLVEGPEDRRRWLRGNPDEVLERLERISGGAETRLGVG